MLEDFSAGSFVPASFAIKEHQRVAVLPGYDSQDLVTFQVAARVVLRKRENVESHWVNPESGRARIQESFDRVLDVLVGHKNDEIFPRWSVAHPRTPAANRVDRLVSPFQSRRAGWLLPGTMSVAPSSVLAKQSTSPASTALSMTVECDASRI